MQKVKENVKIAPFQLIGIGKRTTNDNQTAAHDIPQMWERFMSENLLEKIPNKLSNDIFSLYTEYEGDHTQPYTVMLGCKVSSLDEIPEGMMGKSFAGGTYQKTSVRGNLEEGIVIGHWMEIWQMDIDRAYSADFEIYGENAQNPADAEVEFFIALRE